MEALSWRQVALAYQEDDLRLPPRVIPPGNLDLAFAQLLPRLNVLRERAALKACQDQLICGLIFFRSKPAALQKLTVARELLGSHYIIH